jgi:4-hydroxy-tetrahydrodipicolinate synthase
MVKESTGDITRMERLSELTDGQLPFYNGSNPMILKAFKAGAKGWCTAAPNLLPQPCLDLYAASRAGDWTKAEAIYTELKPFLEFIVAGGLPTTIKGGLELLGQGVGVPRLPLLPLDDSGREELRRLLL